MERMKLRQVGAVLAAASIVLAACGDDDDNASDTTTAQTTEAPATTAGAATTEAPATTAASSESTEAPGTTAATSSTEESSGSGSATQPAGQMVIQPGTCGLDNGEEATGDPIKLGALATNNPAADFTWIPKMAAIYFDCVNKNGGIYGHPIDYHYEDETEIDPAMSASLATKLVEQDKVLGIVGSTSLIECDVNGKYYADHGYYPIIAGVAQGCFTNPNFSAVNMGPYYSSLGGAQAAVRAGAKGTIVVASPDSPGFDLINSGVVEFAEMNGMKGVSILEAAPIADPAGFAQRLAQEAGDGGAVVLDYTGPNVVPVLQAIEDQGLIDKVIWASSTPPNDPTVAEALSDAWDGKFLINAEFNLLDSGGPDGNHMIELHDAANPDFPVSSFAQMGYLVAKAATEALLRMGDGAEYTQATVNEAFKNLTDVQSDMWCKPWYFSSGLPDGNVSNNTDYTVVPGGDVMVKKEDCFEIAALPGWPDKGNPLDLIRAAEAAM
jgi:branched-chain amino acid transport system substrate-binding protein